MAVFARMGVAGHEQVLYCRHAATGLRAVVALHSTVLGPGLGGVRIRDYGSDEAAALDDVLRLSRAMSYKAACAGLACGGGKAVVMAPFPEDRAAGMRALGRAIDGLGGQYVATEDMGMGETDIACLNSVTRHAVGRGLADGGSGDPSPHTADGVIAGMRATLRAAGLHARFSGLRVAVQGCGSVGLAVIARLVAAGAEVAAADVDARAAERAAAAGAMVVAHDDILLQPVDVVAPCSVGGVLDADTIAGLRARAVAGAANNPLAGTDGAARLAARGIVYAPDFVINAGGLINVYDELAEDGYSARRVAERVAAIETTLATVFARAADCGETPEAVALAGARERIAAASRG